jgi:hypothetical protein
MDTSTGAAGRRVRIHFFRADGSAGPTATAGWARIEGGRLRIGNGSGDAILAVSVPTGWEIAAGSAFSGRRYASFAIEPEAVR